MARNIPLVRLGQLPGYVPSPFLAHRQPDGSGGFGKLTLSQPDPQPHWLLGAVRAPDSSQGFTDFFLMRSNIIYTQTQWQVVTKPLFMSLSSLLPSVGRANRVSGDVTICSDTYPTF